MLMLLRGRAWLAQAVDFKPRSGGKSSDFLSYDSDYDIVDDELTTPTAIALDLRESQQLGSVLIRIYPALRIALTRNKLFLSLCSVCPS